MPSSIRSNKETRLIFSPDPASLERTIRKEASSLLTDNNTSVSLDYAQPPSTQTPVPSIDSCSPLSTDTTNFLSTDIIHLTSMDISSRTSIDIEPRDMVAPLILVRDNNGDMHDQEGHMRNAADTEHRSIYTNTNRSTGTPEHRSTTPTESTASYDAVKIRTQEEFAAKHPHPPNPDKMSKIDVARLNALRPKPKPSEQPLEPVRTPSDDGDDPMEEDRVSTGRTLRRRKEKVAKHLKRGANEKEKENFQKRVFRIPIHKPFEEAYYIHRLWMFFRRTQEELYMPSSTRSNKESQLIFSPDPASLERTIRKEARSLSTDNNTSVSLDSAQPPLTQTPVPSTDYTNLPLTDILHRTSIDIPSRTSIDTEPRDMVAPLILVRDNNGDLHDQKGHLRNAAVVKEEKLQEGDFEVENLMSFGGSHWCRSTPDTEHRSIYTNTNRSTGTLENLSTTPTESTASCNAVKILTHEEFAAKHPHPPNPDKVRIDRHANSNIDRHSEAYIDRQPSPPIDRRAPITYRVQMPKIDVARLNALRPKPQT
ncbi:hypothetical protein F2Q69_00030096 [Brassica cretica]|uniref:Uncharacterized protein n=1 Tax=Brassica cretica TaxID=69181 RepID=A0A8S9S9I0_BRACR|nr:hypothetical protein F2Q69_00030096 [Brassica cretica]